MRNSMIRACFVKFEKICVEICANLWMTINFNNISSKTNSNIWLFLFESMFEDAFPGSIIRLVRNQ